MSNKFGLFIHWGLYSLLGLHEQCLARYSIDRNEYSELKNKFNPVKYNPEEWVLMAKKAGMKYICFTAKHHDGFCLWNTKYTDYNVMNTPYGKDVLKMLADACHKHGVKLSIYYSNPDWYREDAFNPLSTHQWAAIIKDNGDLAHYREFVKNQIGELLSNYGEIYSLFWDIPPHIEDKSINELARKLQPNILINDRGFDTGDFSTPERDFDGDVNNARFERMTESCNSIGENAWGYRVNEDFYSLRALTGNIDKVMAMGGSYLLNVGPKGDGSIPEESYKMMDKIGDWYNRMDGCLEDHETDYFDYEVQKGKKCIVTIKNGKRYFHFFDGLPSTGVFLYKYPNAPKSVVLVNNKQKLDFEIRKHPKFRDEVGPVGEFYQVDVLHIYNIPVDDFSNEPIIIEIEW